MKKNIVVKCIIAIIVLSPLLAQPVYAAGELSEAALRLNTIQENVTSGVSMTVIFEAATAVSGGANNNAVAVLFGSNANELDKWCRTEGLLTVAGATTADADGNASTALPSTAGLVAVCVQNTTSGIGDYIYITNVNNLSAGTQYAVTVSGNVLVPSVLGTPTTSGTYTMRIATDDQDTVPGDTIAGYVDRKDIAVYIESDTTVAVTANIDPVFTLDLSASSIALATLTTGAIASQNHTITVLSNANDGYVVEVKDASAGLASTSTGKTITSEDEVLAGGTEGYGISATVSEGTENVDGTNSGVTISNFGYSNLSEHVGDLTTASQRLAVRAGGTHDTVGGAGDVFTIRYKAAIADTTPAADDYTDTVSWIGFGLF